MNSLFIIIFTLLQLASSQAVPNCVRDKSGLQFTLRGLTAGRRVRIQIGQTAHGHAAVDEEVTLTTTDRRFSFAAPTNGFFDITYLNDQIGPDHDVMFAAVSPISSIDALFAPHLNCGKPNEDVTRCQMIRGGHFPWTGTYRVNFVLCTDSPTMAPTLEPTSDPTPAPTAAPRTDVCFGWGDPHVSSFHPISQINGLWNAYDRWYGTVGWESYFKLEKDNGAVLEIKGFHEDLDRNGLTFITTVKAFINNREVFSFRKFGSDKQVVTDASQVQPGAAGFVWPTGSGLAMNNAYSFVNWPEVKLFMSFFPRGGARLDMGVMFTGPAGVPGRNAIASGLCCTAMSCPNRSSRSGRRILTQDFVNPRASLPIAAAPTCPTQQTCCDQFAQHDVIYKSCLVDTLHSCCVTDADESTCCTTTVAKCGVDYTCEDGQTCTDAGFCVQDEPNMCQGEWTPFSECTETCGEGTQSRVYSVKSLAVNGGLDCPNQDGDVETRPCTRGKCGDVCEGVLCESAPVCMNAVGVCEDVSARFVGVRMHQCNYEPLPTGTPCVGGSCDGEGNCSSPVTITSEADSEDSLLDIKSTAIGAGAVLVLVFVVALLWGCFCKRSDKKILDNLWQQKDGENNVTAGDVEQQNSLRF